MLGRIFLLLATLATFHAAFSTYERIIDLSHLKALERPEGSLPQDIVLEIFIALFLGIIGACLNTPPFKEISWSNEMRKHKIDEMDSRLGFASYANRGKLLFARSVARPNKTQ